MKLAVAFATVFLAGSAYSQAPAVLIEACNTIHEPERRLECLKAAINAGPSLAKSSALDSAGRAFADMQSSIDVGISYQNYQIALLDLAKSVAALKQDAVDPRAAKLFADALDAYRDAGTFWERSITFYARRDNGLAYGGGMPVSMNGLDWLVRKYSLPTVKADIWGIERGLPVQSTRSEIWRIGREKYEQAIRPAPKGATTGENTLIVPYATVGEAPERLIVEGMAKNSSCTAAPFAAMIVNTPALKEFAVRCDSGTTLKVACGDGVCKGEIVN